MRNPLKIKAADILIPVIFILGDKTMKIGGFKPNVVSIGGGTGLSTMLRGLKRYTPNITAVVTVADDGGGSGILRDELKMLPPGDIRNCILALSETEPIMEKLLGYRFNAGSLKGQSFGNLFLAAVNGMYNGDFVSAVKSVSDVLKVKGSVLPVTACDTELVAKLENGDTVVGESVIGRAVISHSSRISEVSLRCKGGGDVVLLPDVKEKLEDADIITIGPGSLYTSVLSTLAAGELTECLKAAKAPVVYINNIMTQHGETDGYTAFDHAAAILKYAGKDFMDYCIVNSHKIDTPILKNYAEEEAAEVFLDEDKFKECGIKLIKRNIVGLIDNKYIRHNPNALAEAIMDIANLEYNRSTVSEEGVKLYTPKPRSR